MDNANIILNLTEEQLCTIITALKLEKARATDNGNMDAYEQIDAALSAVLNQPWHKDGLFF